MNRHFPFKLLAAAALLVLAGCSTDGGVVLSGTSVETGAPGELFVWTEDTNPLMKCVHKTMEETGFSSSFLVEFPIVPGGVIRGKGGWKATFSYVDYKRTRIVVVDKNGAVDPALTEKMRSWLDACA